MPVDRFFFEKILAKEKEIILEDQEFHHLHRVTRQQEGSTVEVVNGQGQLALASILEIQKRRAVLKLHEVQTAPLSKFRPILVQAIPKINRLDFIVEKGTELGMEELWLFPGEKSEKKELSSTQQDRLRMIAISAMKQSGRLFLPIIKVMPPLSKWKHFPSCSYFGDILPNAPIFFEKWHKSLNSETTSFFVGPESGFTENESRILKERNIIGVKIHENILRTDTAGIAALALMNHFRLLSERK